MISGKLRSMTAVYLRRGNELLLLYRQGGRVVNDVWTGSAGGHFEPHELSDARACVLRELEEELGITGQQLVGLSLRYIALRYTNGELRQTYYFFAGLADPYIELCSNEGKLQWIPIDRVMSLEMPISAKYAVEHYIKIGQYNDILYTGAIGTESIQFTAMT